MQITKTADHWYKNAIIYCIDVETFLDSNGDGIGDLEGISQRIDYLAEIGVNCIWLMQFYPSPRRDNGYDVSDLYGVAARHGNHGDFVELVRVAHGAVFDAVVDLRPGSAAYGRWFGVELSAGSGLQLYLPAGLAHGFLSLAEGTVFCYKVDDYYAPGDEGGIRWDDPDIDIRWPLKAGEEPILSRRDAAWPTLAESLFR